MLKLESFEKKIFVCVHFNKQILDLFLNNIEIFYQLKNNIIKVKEKVILIGSSISKIEDNINKSSVPVLELKKKFDKYLQTMRKAKLLKT